MLGLTLKILSIQTDKYLRWSEFQSGLSCDVRNAWDSLQVEGLGTGVDMMLFVLLVRTQNSFTSFA